MIPGVLFRRAVASDEGFIDDAWLKSFRLSHFAGPIPMGQYFDVYRAALADLRARGGFELWVAYFAEDTDELFAFAAIERDPAWPARWNRREYTAAHMQPVLLHYVYTKDGARRRGIAEGLILAAGIDPRRPFVHTFKTGAFADVQPHWSGAVFDPLLARFRKAQGDTP